MITRLLSSRSLLTQFLVFNLFVFIILSFFTFLYLKAIQPELILKQSDKHLRVIKNIEANLNIQKINSNGKELKNFLIKSKFLLDEVDQITFLNKEKNIQELLRLKPDLKISLQVIEDSTLKERGLNLEMEAYAKTIFDFCSRIKGTKLNTVLDIGNQYNNSKIKFYLNK